MLLGVSRSPAVGTAILRFRKTDFGRRMMQSKTPTDQQILDATIAPAAERWSPGRENPAIGMDEGILRTLAKHDEGARRAVQLADAWVGPEVPGNKLDAFLCGLLSGIQSKTWTVWAKGRMANGHSGIRRPPTRNGR